MRKGLDVRDFIVDPVVRLHYVEVTPPELASPTGDLARLFEALEREWQLTDLEADLEVIRALQPALEKGKYGVTVAVHEAHQVIGVWPGLHETAYGVAIDIGSTTIAGHLVNLADGAVLASNGVMNPQIRFGEDLMSRVSYAMMHPEGAGEMTSAVRKALDGLIASLAMRAGIKRVDILELALVGNPIMHHLLLGIDPTPLGGAPFALATDRAVRTTAAELGLLTHPGARVYVLPCIAGHVGRGHRGRHPGRGAARGRADDARRRRRHERRDRPGRQEAAARRLEPDRSRLRGRPDLRRPARRARRDRARPDRPRDARAALPGHRRRRLVRRGGLRAGIADTGITGICGSGIIEVVAEMFLAGIVTEDGVIDGGLAARTPRIVPDGRTFSYVLHEGDGSGPARASRSPRTTSARSSWPRPPSTPASGC